MHRLRKRQPGEGVQILARHPFPEGFSPTYGEHPSLEDRCEKSFLQRFFAVLPLTIFYIAWALRKKP
jgi:hypothetical protein